MGSHIFSGEARRPFMAGIRGAGAGSPSVGLFVALTGYGGLSQSVGVDFNIMCAAAALIWSMPALMTFSELLVTEISPWAMFTAVGIANLRNIPIIVAALPLIRESPRMR